MAQPLTQAFEVLGTGSPLMGRKKSAATGDSALLGTTTGTTAKGKSSKAFQGLFAALGRTTLTASANGVLGTATQTGKKAATQQLPDDILAALQSLTPDQMAALQTTLNAMAQGNTAALPQLDATTLNVLDALVGVNVTATATLDGTTAQADTLFTLVSDPKLAQALDNLATRLQALQTALSAQTTAATATTASATAATTDDTTATTAKTAQSGTALAGILTQLAAASGTTAQQDQSVSFTLSDGQTVSVNIADLDSDAFDAFRKLAFADLAPFLTQPRTVRMDSGTVMKVAQGPAFLNDESVSLTTLQQAVANSSVLSAALQQAVASAGNATARTSATGLLTAAATPDAGTQQTGLFVTVMAAAQQKTATAASALATATAAMAATQPATAQTRGFAHAAKGLDNALDGDVALGGFDDALRLHADQSQFSTSSTALSSAKNAAQTHPATHLVSLALQRAAADTTAGMAAQKEFTIQLDPPNLGRVKVTLEIGEDNTVKAKFLAERPETLSLLQKDSSQLERALQDNGFTAASGAMTFDLANNDSFSQNMSQGGGQGGYGASADNDDSGTEFALIETVMPVFVDPVTGLTHVNVVI